MTDRVKRPACGTSVAPTVNGRYRVHRVAITPEEARRNTSSFMVDCVMSRELIGADVPPAPSRPLADRVTSLRVLNDLDDLLEAARHRVDCSTGAIDAVEELLRDLPRLPNRESIP